MSDKYSKRKNSIINNSKSYLPTPSMNTERLYKNIQKKDYLLDYVFNSKNSCYKNNKNEMSKLFSQRNDSVELSKFENNYLLLTDGNSTSKILYKNTKSNLYSNCETTKNTHRKVFNNLTSLFSANRSAITSPSKSGQRQPSFFFKPNDDHKNSTHQTGENQNNPKNIKNLRSLICQNKPTFNFHFVEMAKKIKLNKEINNNLLKSGKTNENNKTCNLTKTKEIPNGIVQEENFLITMKQNQNSNMSGETSLKIFNKDDAFFTRKQIYNQLKKSTDKKRHPSSIFIQTRDCIFPSNQFFGSGNVSSIKSTNNTSNCKNSFTKNVINLDNLENPEELHLASVNFFKYQKKMSSKIDKVNMDNDKFENIFIRSNNFTIESVSIFDVELDL